MKNPKAVWFIKYLWVKSIEKNNQTHEFSHFFVF
jgi:hypothetical protein